MKLRDFLDVWFDETWIRIVKTDRSKIEVWMADYIGGHEPTMEELDPYLDCELDDNTYLTTGKDPETGKRATFVCVELFECPKKISRDEIFKAVAKNNGYRGRQKIDSFYRDGTDELVFCNNIPDYGGEHYAQDYFCEQMTRYFPQLAGTTKVSYEDGCFIFQ